MSILMNGKPPDPVQSYRRKEVEVAIQESIRRISVGLTFDALEPETISLERLTYYCILLSLYNVCYLIMGLFRKLIITLLAL